jgi:hypothetical protein
MMREPSTYRKNRHSRGTRKIIITLSRDLAMQDWSIVINGQRHEHVTSEVLEALVECKLIVAQTFLTPEPDDALDLSVLEAMGQR